MSVNVLEILSAIEKEGNFRKAAATLGVTQPYLSQVVQRLEKECRGLIVDRHHKPFKLTELGNIIWTLVDGFKILRKKRSNFVPIMPI